MAEATDGHQEQGQAAERPYADPQDLQFGKAAAEKEERADKALEHGEADRLAESPQSESPRPGNKA